MIFFRKIRRRAVLFFILLLLVGAGIGAAESLKKSYDSGKRLSSLKDELAAVRTKYSSGRYEETVKAISGLGSERHVDDEAARFGIQFPGDGGWRGAVDVLYGRAELKTLVDRSAADLVPAQQAKANEPSVSWPDIKLLGATYSKNMKLVTVMSVGGKTEIWSWQKKGGEYVSDSMIPGFDIRSVEVSRDKLLFSLHPIERIEMFRKYEMDTSPDKELSKYAVQDP